MKCARTLLFLQLILFLALIQGRPCQAQENKNFAALFKNLGSESSLAVYDLDSKKLVLSYQPDLALKPASVLKILTAKVALEQLGPEYTFKTQVWLKDRSGSAVDTLLIRGGADPSLNIETAWLLARSIYRRGIRNINTLAFDDSAFKETRQAQGQRAYEAGASALSFNYNSVAIEVCPTKPEQNALINIDPIELPIKLSGSIKTKRSGQTNFSIEQLDSNPNDLSFKASGAIALEDSCVVLYRAVSDPVQSFALVFRELLQKEGVKIAGKSVKQELNPKQYELFINQPGKTLRQLVDELNHYSSNFIAEQILHGLGEVQDSVSGVSTFDRELGIKSLIQQLDTLQVEPSQYKILDASGLSHANRISSRLLARLLLELAESERVGVEFASSLSVAGRSGTLKKRDFDLPAGAVRAKTGTLDSVSSLAGYLNDASGRRRAFVIIQNGRSKEQATEYEERFVKALYQMP